MTDAATLTRDLGGKWLGRYGCAPCPVCQPERRKGQNALTVADGRDGRLLLNCKKSVCSFHDILAAAGVAPGSYTPPDPATIAQRDREERAQAEKRARQAERCWQEALPIGSTIAERYLRGRKITCDLPGTLRYHPSCWHLSAKRFPALVALIEGAGGFAVHRTYLRPDGTGKAEIDPAKAMLGAVAGGAVRLTQGPGPLLIGEGIESTLSALILHGNMTATAWAALSASGMHGLRLPPVPGRLTIATDGDPVGAGAGRDLAERAHATGWAVSMLPAPKGRDWNDILIGKAVMA